MVIYQNDCCDCAAPGYPCIGASCTLRHSAHYFCDKCDEEVDMLYWYDGMQLCTDCIIEDLEVVKADE